jgi:hypothetical protein
MRKLLPSDRGERLRTARAVVVSSTALLLLLSLAFPPWVESAGVAGWNLAIPLGYHIFFNTPNEYTPGYFVHIDYARVGYQAFLILVVGASAFLLTLLRVRPRRRAPVSEDLLTQLQKASSEVFINGYRRVARERGCAPTSKTSDAEIVQLYKQVGTAFRQAAEQRDELLNAGSINTIVLKFLQIRERDGAESVEERLTYEVERYLKEGLRADYRQELRLI